MAGGRLIGDAYIVIYPQTDLFGPQAKAAVDKALAAVRGQVTVVPKMDKRGAAQVQADLSAIGDKTVNVSAQLTDAAIAKIQAQIKSLTGQANLGLALDPAQIAKVEAQLKTVTDTVGLNLSASQANMAAVKAQISSYFGSGQGVPIRPTVSAASAAAARAALASAFSSGQGVPVRATLNPAGLAAMKASASAFLNSPAVMLQVNTLPATAKITAFGAYTKQVMSNAININWGAQLASALAANSAIASLNTTFSKLGGTSRATAAIAAASAAQITGAFLNMSNNGVWSALTARVTLFAGVFDKILPEILTSITVWHFATDWLLEFTAVLVPAAIALGSWAAVMTVVGAGAAQKLQSIATAAGATGEKIGVFSGVVSTASGPLRTLENQLNPTVWELYGDALTVMSSKAGTFQTVVRGVNTVVEDLAARMTLAFSSATSGTLIQNGVLDFQRFGTIIGNLGGAFGNFIKDVPGYAQIIEEFWEKVTAGIEAFTAVAGPIIKAGLALHGFIVYVGVATTAGVALLSGMGNLIAKFFTFTAAATNITAIGARIETAFLSAGIALTDFVANFGLLAGNPYVLALAAIGLAAYAIVNDFNSASTSVSTFIRTLTTAINQMQGGAALQSIPAALAKINEQIKEAASPAAYQQLASNWSNLSNTGNAFAKDAEAVGQDLGNAFKPFYSNQAGGILSFFTNLGKALKDLVVPGGGIQIQVGDNIKALQAAYDKLSTSEKDLLTVTGQLMQGTLKIPGTNQLATTATFNYAQSLGILNAAGVQASDSLATMQTKVEGLVQGWNALGLTGGQVGNAVNALTFDQQLNQNGVSKLAQSYTAFITTLTGGETAFSTYGEGLNTISQALSTAGASGITFSDTLGKFTVKGTAAGATLDGLTQSSLNARAAFATEITNATSLYNSLQVLATVSDAGAKGQGALAQAGKDMVASLLPLAKGSSTALAELSGLAQIAGGPATDSFQTLSNWVGKVNDPMKDLNSIEGKLTVSSVNLATDAQNLSTAFGQTLTQAIAGAIFAAEKGPAALGGLADAMNALATHKGDISGVETALTQAIPALVEMSGSSKAAEAQFLAMAGALHISQQQATAMWNAVMAGKTPLATVTAESQIFTTSTERNMDTLVHLGGTLAQSAGSYTTLWASIVKADTGLQNNSTYAANAKNAFISFAENGLDFSSAAAKRLWTANASQNLVSLAGKAGTTENAFISMAKNGLGLTTTQATQLWNTLRLQYLDTLVAKGKGAENQFIDLAKSGLGLTTTAAQNLWDTMRNQYLDTLAQKAGTTTGQFVTLAGKLGVSKQAAIDLWTSLKNLPASVKIAIDETIAGGGKITVQGNIVSNATTGIATSTVTGEQTFNGYAYASGGTVPGTSSNVNKDTHLAAVKGGELIIPSQHAPKFADMARKASIPGFAAGGLAGYASGGPVSDANAVATMNAASIQSVRDMSVPIVGIAGEALVNAMAKQLVAAQAAAAISLAGVSNASALAALQTAAAKAGWTGVQWAALEAVEEREAGFSLTATNPSSGAYGMAQFINGASEYAQYGGNSTTAAGQAVAMVNYIKQRYGTPAAAWQHELDFGWYSGGGQVKPYSAGGMVSEPVLGRGVHSGMPYSFAENGPEYVGPLSGSAGSGASDAGLTRFALNRIATLMEQQNKMLAQQPYSMAQALTQANGSGVRRGYFATSG